MASSIRERETTGNLDENWYPCTSLVHGVRIALMSIAAMRLGVGASEHILGGDRPLWLRLISSVARCG